MTATIYALVDPFTQAIRYIGMTRRPLRRRLLEHLNQRCNAHKLWWLLDLRERGVEPEIVPLDTVRDLTKSTAIEREWIDWGIAHGLALLNREAPISRPYQSETTFTLHELNEEEILAACHQAQELCVGGRIDWVFDAESGGG